MSAPCYSVATQHTYFSTQVPPSCAFCACRVKGTSILRIFFRKPLVLPQVRDAVATQEPKFTASREMCDWDYMIVRDLPPANVDPKGGCPATCIA